MKWLWKWIGRGIGWAAKHPEVIDPIITAIVNRTSTPHTGAGKVDPPATPQPAP
jgi:hypothetical protein